MKDLYEIEFFDRLLYPKLETCRRGLAYDPADYHDFEELGIIY